MTDTAASERREPRAGSTPGLEGPEGGQAGSAESSEFSERISLRLSSCFPSFPFSASSDCGFHQPPCGEQRLPQCTAEASMDRCLISCL